MLLPDTTRNENGIENAIRLDFISHSIMTYVVLFCYQIEFLIDPLSFAVIDTDRDRQFYQRSSIYLIEMSFKGKYDIKRLRGLLHINGMNYQQHILMKRTHIRFDLLN